MHSHMNCHTLLCWLHYVKGSVGFCCVVLGSAWYYLTCVLGGPGAGNDNDIVPAADSDSDEQPFSC